MTHSGKNHSVYWIVLLMVGLAGCSKKPDFWRGRIEIINGVRVITSDAPALHHPDSLAQIILTRDLVIEGDVTDSSRAFPDAYGVATDRQGNIYIADTEHCRILKFDAGGTFQRSLGTPGVGPLQFRRPVDVTVDRAGNLYVLDNLLDRVTIFNPRLQLLDLFDTEVTRPRRIRIDTAGNILVFAVTQRDLVYKFSPRGEVLQSFYDPLESLRLIGTLDQLLSYSDAGMEVSRDGYVYLSSRHPYRIVKFDRVAGLALEFSRTVAFGMGTPDFHKKEVPQPFGTSGFLGILPDGRILNMLHYQEFSRLAQADSDQLTDLSELQATTVKRWLDVFTPDGRWQMTSQIPVRGFPMHIDKSGKIYFVELNPSRIVRYAIRFPAEAR